MRTGASDFSSRGLRGRTRPEGRLSKARKARLRWNALEWLESRTLLAVIPPPTLTAGAIDVSSQSGGNAYNQSSPQVAVNRYDPQKLVAVWVTSNPDFTLTPDFVQGAYSTNGGQTWTSFAPTASTHIDPTSSDTSPVPFTFVGDPSVAFDANNHFYVLAHQRNGGNTAGELILTQFDFSGDTPIRLTYHDRTTGFAQSYQSVREYIGDSVFNPTMVVDDNLASYTDPVTHVVQDDPYSGNIYVAWNTNEAAPDGFEPIDQWNPSSILMVSSSDGGQVFTNPLRMNATGAFSGGRFGLQRMTTPSLIVSQGRAPGTNGPNDPGVPAGQVTAVWDNYGDYEDGLDRIMTNRIVNGTATDLFTAAFTAPITTTATAADLPKLVPIAGDTKTTSTIAMSSFPANYVISNITVTIGDLQYPRNANLVIRLIGPNGNSVVLFSTPNDQNGANFSNTVFTDSATTPIVLGTAPYTGSFIPYDPNGLSFLNNQAANGNYTLEIDTPGAPPTGQLTNWSITVTATSSGTGLIASPPANAPPLSTDFPLFVDLTSDPNFTTLSHLTATLNITQNNLSNLSADLIAPNGLGSVHLFSNKPNQSPLGLTGNNLGRGSYELGTTLDDDAPRFINDAANAAPYVGSFRPEPGNFLGIFNGRTAAELSGVWILRLTEWANTTDVNSVSNWSLNFTSGFTRSNPQDTIIATTGVIGSQAGTSSLGTAIAGAVGIVSNPVLAADNTLGSFSPHQGRIYASWVGWSGDIEIGGYHNPTDNTDIYLSYSDDGGQSWSGPRRLNNDFSPQDGYSESNPGANGFVPGVVTGRAQFLPAIAVDQATGTLVATWRDARDDASRTRTAMYMTTSIDGGQSFSQETYLNPPKTATDAITGQTVAMSPQLDNVTGLSTAPPYGFGVQTGLAVYDGQVYPMWVGNFNQSTVNPVQGVTFDVYYRPTVITAGPRIISGTEGQIPLPNPSSPETTFQVTFDRPIDPARVPTKTFTPNDVQVYYHSTQTVTQTATGLPLPILPPPGSGPPAGNPTPYKNFYTMTVSGYNGQTVTAAELNLSLNFPRNADLTIKLSNTQGDTATLWTRNYYYDQGQNFVNTTFTDTAAQSIMSLSGAPYTGSFRPLQSLNAAFVGSQVNDTYTLEIDTAQPLEFGELLNWTLTLRTDSQFIPLQVTNVSPAPGSSVGPNGWFGYTTFNVTFDPTKLANGSNSNITNFTGTYSYLIQPTITDQIRAYVNTLVAQSPIGPVNSVNVPLRVPTSGSGGTGTSADVTTSSINLNGFGNQLVTGLDVNLTIQNSRNGDLAITLIAPDGRSVVLYQKSGDTGIGFTGTTFSDSASTSILNATAPYSGTFQPVTPLSNLNGAPVNGTWLLQIRDSVSGGPINAQLTSWSLVVRSAKWQLSPTPQTGNQVDQNADGTAGQNALATPFRGLTPGDVYAAPMPQPNVPTTFGTNPLSIISPPFDTKSLPLIVPGPSIVNTFVPNVAPSQDNLVLNATNSILNVTFDRPMQVSTFTPANVLQIMGPAGPIIVPQTFSAAASSLGPIPDATTSNSITTPGTLNSILTVPKPIASDTFPVGKVTVRLNLTHPNLPDLSAVLVAPDGSTQVTLFDAGDLLGANLIGTVFDDAATKTLAEGSAPYTGLFQITDPNLLKFFNGKSAIGDWTLQITDHATGQSGTLNSWSLTITPQVTVSAVNPANFNGKLAATTFQIGFPQQFLSGTYTLQLGPDYVLGTNIQDTYGQAIDSNLNAGLDVLRGQGNNVPTTTVTFGSTTSMPITAASSPSAPSVLMSTVNVPDDFVIPTGTPSGRTGVRVRLDVSYANDPDLTAILYYHFGQADQKQITLFSGVGNKGPNKANFSNTLFDDSATTPIQQAAAPFFNGPFNPQESLLNAFGGLNSGGNWTLVIQNASTSSAGGSLNSWSLFFEKPQPTSGLGEPTADQTVASFRIFTMDPANALSRSTWTTVGPAPLVGHTGRIGGLAVDPSDPSGNTVFVGGSSGGIWKTTNFLTTDPLGPTYIPLTDFGPSNGINVGGIAVFPRQDNPTKSFVVASTGEGDTQSAGVGFLISQDGGATWNLFDSTTNVDASGNLLPINSPLRDRAFVGSTSYKVVVDPNPSPNGQVIIYAAISGNNGGLWRSLDSGAHWVNMRAGQCNDVVLDPASDTGGSGNLQNVYAAFRGEGVYFSQNQGQSLSLMTGGIGNPLIYSSDTDNNVNPVAGLTPNGAQGRIVLAKPELTGNPVRDKIYQGWLYAVVATPAGGLYGIFLTKDFGQNWTQVRIPTMPPVDDFNQAVPTNDVSRPDYAIFGGGGSLGAQGNYDMALAVDPNDPNIIYLGGMSSGGGTGLIRIDSTKIWDAHALVPYADNALGGGVRQATTGAVTVNDVTVGVPASYLNFIRNPGAPFLASATLQTNNVGQFTNNGFGVTWTPFDLAYTDYHRVFTMIDPTTGLTRIVFGNDQGVFSGLDNNGSYSGSVGTNPNAGGILDRNGNLQITQFYYGAAQPSNLGAQIAGALFYGGAQDNGAPESDPNVLQNGNIRWGGGAGDASGMATDQQGLGTNYKYMWPCCGGDNTDFFQVNYTGRTFGLVQQSGGMPTPDPQWPYVAGTNFTVNPLNGNQIIISSSVGRVFATEDQGVTWFPIGEPGDFGSPGTFSNALTYGAPDPNAPGGIGNLDSFIYVGTQTGQIYVTQTRGGTPGGGSAWTLIGSTSNGLDGSGVQRIVANPTRGSHEAYAITRNGVYWIADSLAPGATWTNISGALAKSIHNQPYDIFGQPYNPLTDTNPNFTYNQPLGLNALVADWRYAIPDSATNPTGPVHPILYVSANSGVYRSIDKGVSWTLFPTTALDGAPADGGFLPHANVTDLSLSLGNIDRNTGMPNLVGPYDIATASPVPDPDLLLATTYGRGSFGIRLAPLTLNAGIDPSTPTNGTDANGNLIVTTGTPTFSGLSTVTGFKNATWISIRDLTPDDENYGKIIGGFDRSNPDWKNQLGVWTTDANGVFAIKTYSGATGFTTNGAKTIEIFATDDAGAVGNSVTLSFTIQATDFPPVAPKTAPTAPTLAISPFDITGPDKNVVPPFTNHPNPVFNGTTSPSDSTYFVTVELLLFNPASGQYESFAPAVTTVSDGLGAFSLVFPSTNHGVPIPDGTYTVEAKATWNAPYDTLGSTFSNPVTFVLKTHGPKTAPTLVLQKTDDSGFVVDNITNVRKPHFVNAPGAKVDPQSIIQIYQAPLVYDQQGNITNTLLAQTTATSSGLFSVQLPQALNNGSITLIATAVDAAGNRAPSPSKPLTVTIVTVGSDYSGNLVDYNNSPIVYQAPASSVNKPISSATTTTLSSALTINSQNPTANVAGLTVQLNVTHANLANLSAVLVAPDGKTKVTLFGVGALNGGTMAGTIFSDSATADLATGTSPYAGTFLTADPKGLAQLAGQSINGTWTLQLTDNIAGNTGTLTNWSLAIRPTPVTATATVSSTGSTAIPGPPSTISVTGQGDTTTVGNISVALNLTYSNLADLSAALIGPDGKTKVTLFNAGDLNGANLVNTVFNVTSTTALSTGTAPYTGTFKPSDAQGLAKLLGQMMNGTWTLQITDTVTGRTGSLTSWSLTLTPQPSTTPRVYPLVPGPVIPAGTAAAPGSLTSPLTISGQAPLAKVGGLTVQLNVTDMNLANLGAVLVAPDGNTRVTLFNPGDLTGSNLVNTNFSDSATLTLDLGGAPYTGTFKTNDPAGLAKLAGQAINGTWKLVVTNEAIGQSGTLNSWSLLIQPAQSSTLVPAATPSQAVAIPDAAASTLSSTVTVSGRGDTLKLANLTVRLSLNAPNLANLSAALVSPDGKITVPLFNAGDLAGTTMINTTFSPSSAYPAITNGTAPYTAVFSVPGLAQYANLSLNGVWTLKISNIAAANAGTLTSWSLGMTPRLATPPQPAQAEGALFVRDTTSGNGLWYVQPSAPSNVPIWFNNGRVLGDATGIPLQGDFDGDGKTDLAAYNQQTALWSIFSSSSNGVSFTFGTPSSATYSGSIPLVGNFHGPGASEIAVFDIVSTRTGPVGQWTITNLTTGTQPPIQFGLPGDVPIVGDFDGVGKDQLAVFRPSTAQFIVYQGAGNPVEILTIPGVAPSTTLVPVPAQYDNITIGLPYKTEIAVFDTSTGVYKILGPNQTVRTVAFAKGDIPAPADYLGNGEIQPAVFRPSTMQFLQKGATGNDVVIATFANLSGATVVPVAAPLFFRIPNSGGQTTPTEPPSTPPVTPPATPPSTPPATPPVTPPSTPPAPPTPPPNTNVVTPTVMFAPGSAVVVNGIMYANGRRPWFTGTAAAGSVVQVVLSGASVIGRSKVIATVAANAANSFTFQLPAGIRNGTYTLMIRVTEPGAPAVRTSTPLAFRVGPIPRVRTVRRPPVRVNRPRRPFLPPARPAVQMQHHAAAAHAQAAAPNARVHVVDQAVHALAQHPLFRKRLGR